MRGGGGVTSAFMAELVDFARRHLELHAEEGHLQDLRCCLTHLGPGADRDEFLVLLDQLLAEDRARTSRVQSQHAELQRLLDGVGVDIALQPVVDLTSGRCTSVEALARFPASLGPPDAAFALAQAVGLRFELECLAAGTALRVLPLLRPGQSLAINLSPDVAARVVRRAPEDLPVDQVVLEITEHAAVVSYQQIREAIRPLRERGLRLSIDDAGAGFASLRHIVELRPDIIKIDRSLVEGADSDVARRSVITTFVLLALDIGATVVAEGVETYGELEAVATLGVDAAQGYLLARPTTSRDELTRWAGGSLLPSTPADALSAG